MPDLKNLPTLFGSFGYVVTDAKASGGFVVGEIHGGNLQDVKCVLRASGDLANIGIVIGLFDAVPERARYALLGQLLELNFDHPLAHTSLVQVSSEQGRSSLIIAETSFFWSDTNKARMDARAAAIHAIAFAASQLLASRSALSSINPFYSKLKGSTSPVAREDAPKPQPK